MLAAAVLIGVVAAAGAVSPPTASADDVPGTPVTVTVAPTSGLTDGALLTVNIKTTAAYPIYAAEAKVCRPGVAYQTSRGARPAPDFDFGSSDCPAVPISSSADLQAVDYGIFDLTQTPEGETFPLRVGTGKADWPDRNGVKRTLTCDSANPCTLVVQLFGGNPAVWKPVTVGLTYRPDDPIAGCGGPAQSILDTGASDRMSDAWIEWTVGVCASGKLPSPGAPTRANFAGEGLAVSGFDDGSLDLAYTAVGYDDKVGFLPAGAPPQRAAVLVPVAINATVIGVGNGRPGPNGRKLPYEDLKLSLDEAAAMISGGPTGLFASPYGLSISQRNPELATGIFNSTSAIQAGGPSEAEATNWFLTRHFQQLRPAVWKVPDAGVFGDEAGQTRGADASLALAQPSYRVSLSLFSGRKALQKVLFQQWLTDTYGGIWIVTDEASAKAQGLTVVQLENATGQFQTPTSQNMTAAIGGMQKTADGRLLPDPRSTGGYPLTFVEYAMVPAEPLVDTETCTLRSDSQALLTSWLDFVTGDGQKALPAGMAPLTPELQAQAKEAIAKVGKTPVTGKCQGVDQGGGGGASGGGGGESAAGTVGDFSSGDFSSGDFSSVDLPSDFSSSDFSSDDVLSGADGTGSSSDPGESGAPSADGKKEQNPELAAANSGMPDFAGRRGVSSFLALLAIAAVVVLTSLSAKLTSGYLRKPPGKGFD
ncbi:MAG: hypothetical protein R2726_22500 [Acidimicrobiales bacterium]